MLTESQKQLATDNINLVYYMVHKMGFNAYHPDFDDFVSAGMEGLVKAANTFDSKKGFKFTSYAARCINNDILIFMRKKKKWNPTVGMIVSIHIMNHPGPDGFIADGEDYKLEWSKLDDYEFISNEFP